MEFSNENLLKMHDNRAVYNKKFSEWYLDYFIENGGSFESCKETGLVFPAKNCSPTLFNQSDRLGSCMDFWAWDKYEKNKILDLQRVNRCKNTRFCPNCKMLDVAKFIHKFREIFNEYINLGYKFYMLTLTVPSCVISGEALKEHIENLSKCFAKFFKKFGYEDDKAYNDRLFSIYGGIRVLEITCNEVTGFHPHLHCIVLLKDEPPELLLEKNIEGKFSRKAGERVMLSAIDMQIAKIWGMIWHGHRLTQKNIENYIVRPQETFVEYYGEQIEDKVLQVDFRLLDEGGIFEVFKYTFKSSDVATYEIFKGLVDALAYKRIRQGFGVLFNVKVNDDELDNGEEQALVLDIPEDPQQLITREILSLVNEYGSYRKISRFQAKEVQLVNIDD